MLVLGKAKAGQTLSLGGGASLTYRAATSIDWEAGEAAAREFFRKVREGQAALEDYGLPGVGLEALKADDMLTYGASSVVSLTEIAVRCVSAWEGVVDEDRRPLPINRLTLSALLRERFYFLRVRDALLSPLHAVIDEGKDSAPSQNGEQEAGAPIADPAAPMDTPAPTASPA